MTLIRCYHSGPEWTWEQWQWRGTPHSPMLQHCWNLTIRLFSVISRTLVRGGLTPLQRCSQCILQPQLTGQSLVRGGRSKEKWDHQEYLLYRAWWIASVLLISIYWTIVDDLQEIEYNSICASVPLLTHTIHDYVTHCVHISLCTIDSNLIMSFLFLFLFLNFIG